MNKYNNFHVVDHPLIRHKLTLIRDKKTGHQLFRELVNEVGNLVAFELTRDIPSQNISVETPIMETTGVKVDGKNVVLVPILRAGLGMERDETTHEPVHYYFKIPKKPEDRHFIIVDPMLATGGTAIATTNSLKELGATQIKFMCLIAAPEGVSAFCEVHPDVQVYAASLDEKLNENKYIVPGLGDAGDRLFGTK